MEPTMGSVNGREVCASNAGLRWRCECKYWWDWSIEKCRACKSPRDVASAVTVEAAVDERLLSAWRAYGDPA
jgi:hypothetical protein